jgi:GH24 family phage-related lysozyme (muramidase)
MLLKLIKLFFNKPEAKPEVPAKPSTSQRGLDLIKKFEGYRSKAYQCSAKVWTIGYGTTRYSGGQKVAKGDVIDKETAETYLREDVKKFEEAVQELVKVELNQNQFDALVSWTYNLGQGNLKRSRLLKRLNEGDYAAVPAEMKRWTRAGGKVLKGLVRRRAAEAELFASE